MIIIKLECINLENIKAVKVIESFVFAISNFDWFITKAIIDLCKINKPTNRGYYRTSRFQVQ